jgi:hypothetical protein
MLRALLILTGLAVFAALALAIRSSPHTWAHLLGYLNAQASHGANSLNVQLARHLPAPRSTP